ncbi:hypothetical protein HBI26_254390 [Parastagonospora nodorum]|nr:hypothetical protein HBH51_259010 [Parastagonospora nodorum]KAH4354202.1 hypothetical protein HBH97_254530 [Parastagonospora nodorum]KAH5046120.1 hypothetical protein HBI73_251250 [Parastagonospora nodorum]KAH5088035.1 hypothetical protein HBH72_251100 [Parastagonospora nodorum]KAH5094920.1 hypothetical protein HBH71_256470 [Parastagonospora nodorum]
MTGLGEELVALKQRQSHGEKDRMLAERNAAARLDRICLQFCISLLDHTPKGDLFESTVVGFLAVLAVDPEKEIFREASSFTSYLSAFVKISQMLVIRMSVTMSKDGEIEHPADVLDEMRERFLMHGTRSPFNWVLRLRAYGKRIRNSTTSLGYIYWSDDHEKLTYKQLEMTMAGFKAFVRTEVAINNKAKPRRSTRAKILEKGPGQVFSHERLQEKRLKRAETDTAKEAKVKGKPGQKGKNATQEGAEATTPISMVRRGRKRGGTALEVEANLPNVEAGPSVPKGKVARVSDVQAAEAAELLCTVPVVKMYQESAECLAMLFRDVLTCKRVGIIVHSLFR